MFLPGRVLGRILISKTVSPLAIQKGKLNNPSKIGPHLQPSNSPSVTILVIRGEDWRITYAKPDSFRGRLKQVPTISRKQRS
jgi:hypothetical protein